MKQTTGATGPTSRKTQGPTQHHEGSDDRNDDREQATTGSAQQPPQPGVIGDPGSIRDDDTFRASAQAGTGVGTMAGDQGLGTMAEPAPQQPQMGGYGAPAPIGMGEVSTAPPPAT